MYKDKKGLLITHIGRILISLIILIIILTQQFSVVITEGSNNNPMVYLIEAYDDSKMLENDTFLSDFFDGDVTSVGSLEFAASCIKSESSLTKYKETWDRILDQLNAEGEEEYKFINGQGQIDSIDQLEISNIILQLIFASISSLIAGILIYFALVICVINIVAGILSLVVTNNLWDHPEIQKAEVKYVKGYPTFIPCIVFALAAILFQAGTMRGVNAVIELTALETHLQVVTVAGISPILFAAIILICNFAFEYYIQKRYIKK